MATKIRFSTVTNASWSVAAARPEHLPLERAGKAGFANRQAG
jgi:hypothetical protein